MTICPIAIVAGCKKCPAFNVCPLKTVLGDQVKAEQTPTETGHEARKAEAPKPLS